jgi:TonB family protein
LISAEDIYHPYASGAYGPVILEAYISAKGAVKDIVATQPIVSLTEPSIKSILNWKFKPATLGDKPVASRLTIAILFNSYALKPFKLPDSMPDHELPKIDTPFFPPEVISVKGAIVGNALVGDGTVVLQVKINSSGELNYASVVRNSPSFTPLALKAIQEWKFAPGIFGDAPISSTMPVAFVFHIVPQTTNY